MGGLLHFLHSQSVLMEPELDAQLESSCIRAIEAIPFLGDVLDVDGATMDSLSLFTQDVHPASRPSRRNSKEGFSVFSVLNLTKTVAGARMLRAWLTYPSTDMKIIQERQTHVKYFTSASNSVRKRTSAHGSQTARERDRKRHESSVCGAAG